MSDTTERLEQYKKQVDDIRDLITKIETVSKDHLAMDNCRIIIDNALDNMKYMVACLNHTIEGARLIEKLEKEKEELDKKSIFKIICDRYF
jgi:hypothetical protein